MLVDRLCARLLVVKSFMEALVNSLAKAFVNSLVKSLVKYLVDSLEISCGCSYAVSFEFCWKYSVNSIATSLVNSLAK